ncbi:hypothetical protein NA57DRAFT_80149 [Rhizodiscina lignyota]|uniref:SsuA/THI5-like domain-containing protein n=1 Tax=Rhizodiscina lignyota TaxID=1504668 RepID=A0A9P4I9Q3_9PEZI|nr:hypothetical protein NA57DRAFT_80149 [Rhizodiscina lignyota]
MLLAIFCILAAVNVSALETVVFGAFTQTATYSVANQLGLFTEAGLNVIFEAVPNSTYAYAQVLNGGYDILTGTIDNAVNLRFNSNETLTVIGQLDQGPDLTLASAPNITTVEDLKGKPLIVDSPVSGYAYLLRKILESHGLLLENGDYYFQTVGSTNLRYPDLVAGTLPNGTEVYATILTYPFTAAAETLPAAQRLNILSYVADVVDPVVSTAFTIREDALANATMTPKLTRFVSAMYAANLYLNNPANKNCSVNAIAKQLNVTLETAELDYTAAIQADTGEVSPGGNFTVNEEGLMNIINVRQEFGGFTVPADFNFTEAIAPGTGKLIDYSIRDAAIASCGKRLLDISC